VSDCCSHDSDAVCALPQSKPGFCPACGQKAKSVPTLTVKNLVRDHTRVPVSASYSFCRTTDCDVVYFSNEAVFRKADLKVRVGVKETEDPVALCYCFDYTRRDVRRDIEATGSTRILEKVKAEVQGGFCACEMKNPAGTCCLGDITRAIQEAKQLVAAKSSVAE
jgi:hypothetical protein